MAKSLEDLTVDELLAHAKAATPSAELFNKLLNTPETRETMQRAIKKVAPGVAIPEIDAKDSVLGVVQELKDDNAKLRQEIQHDRIVRDLESTKAKVTERYKLSADDMLQVEKLMVREVDPIPSYEAAAQVFTAMRQSATPTPAVFSPPTFDLPEKDVWGKGIGNKAALDKIAMSEAFKAFNEIHSGNARAN